MATTYRKNEPVTSFNHIYDQDEDVQETQMEAMPSSFNFYF